MNGRLKGKKKDQRSEPVLSLPVARQPSGYSSASFYDLSSLPSLTESTTDLDFEYSSPSESTSFSEDATPAHSEHSSSSVSSAPVSSLARTAKPPAGSSSHSERQSGAESGPTLERVASGDAASFGPSSGLEERVADSDSPRLRLDGDPAAARPVGHPPSGTASPQSGPSPVRASPASSLASGPSELPQRAGHPGNPSLPSSGDESDLEGPVRFVVYSPHITRKDLRGDCSCWLEKKKRL